MADFQLRTCEEGCSIFDPQLGTVTPPKGCYEDQLSRENSFVLVQRQHQSRSVSQNDITLGGDGAVPADSAPGTPRLAAGLKKNLESSLLMQELAIHKRNLSNQLD